MDVYSFLAEVREKKPLVHHLTNWVTIYDCAQVVKSLGASPVMAHAPEEVADMAGMASGPGPEHRDAHRAVRREHEDRGPVREQKGRPRGPGRVRRGRDRLPRPEELRTDRGDGDRRDQGQRIGDRAGRGPGRAHTRRPMRRMWEETSATLRPPLRSGGNAPWS